MAHMKGNMTLMKSNMALMKVNMALTKGNMAPAMLEKARWNTAINPLNAISFNHEIPLHVKWSNFWNTNSNFTKFSG